MRYIKFFHSQVNSENLFTVQGGLNARKFGCTGLRASVRFGLIVDCRRASAMLQYRFVSTEFQLFEIRSTPCLPATWFHCIRIEKAVYGLRARRRSGSR